MRMVNGCKDVSIISSCLQDEQRRWTSFLFLHTVMFLFYEVQYNRKQSKHKQTICKHSRQKSTKLKNYLNI